MCLIYTAGKKMTIWVVLNYIVLYIITVSTNETQHKFNQEDCFICSHSIIHRWVIHVRQSNIYVLQGSAYYGR